MWWTVLLGAVAGLVALWVALLLVLWRVQPDGARLRELLRLLPDVLRLVARLARDRSLPVTVRVRLWALLAYLASPVDLVPDVIPGLGVVDDVVLVALTLRSVVRRAGPDALARHWPGTPEGRAALERVAGLDGRKRHG